MDAIPEWFDSVNSNQLRAAAAQAYPEVSPPRFGPGVPYACWGELIRLAEARERERERKR